MQKKLGQLAYLFGQFHGHSEVILDGLGGRGLLLLMLLLVMWVGSLCSLQLGSQLGLGCLLLPFPEFSLPAVPFPDFTFPALLLDPLLLPLLGFTAFPGVEIMGCLTSFAYSSGRVPLRDLLESCHNVGLVQYSFQLMRKWIFSGQLTCRALWIRYNITSKTSGIQMQIMRAHPII